MMRSRAAESRSSAGRRWALRDVLLAAQIALCCVTVTAAFVSLRGLGKAMTMNMGINPKHAMLTKFELSQAGYSNEASDHFQRQLLDRVSHSARRRGSRLRDDHAALHGYDGFRMSSRSRPPISSPPTVHSVPSTTGFHPGYFTATGTPMLAGRDVSFTDTPKTPAVAIVNQEFARRLFTPDDAVGRYFKNSSGQPSRLWASWPMGNIFLLPKIRKPAAFFPMTQGATGHTSFIVRMRADSSDLAAIDMAATMRKVIRDLDPAIPVRESGPWKNQLGLTFFVSQVATAALGLFGAFGLLLSITGTFGLASYTVSKRLRELSIRVALGAQAKQIFSAALGRMMILLASGSCLEWCWASPPAEYSRRSSTRRRRRIHWC